MTEDAFDSLTRLGWSRGVVAIVAGLSASFLLLGYAIVYWRNADLDFMVIYNALVMNDGKPQIFFDHTAYLTILTVKSWFRLLHGLGLLDAYSLSAIPTASDEAFDTAMTQAVRAGRVLAFLIATSGALIFAGLTRLIAARLSCDILRCGRTPREPIAAALDSACSRLVRLGLTNKVRYRRTC